MELGYKDLDRLYERGAQKLEGLRRTALAPDNEKPPITLSQQEASQLVGVHPSTMARKVADGTYPSGHLPGNKRRRRFRLDEVHQMMEIEGTRLHKPAGTPAKRITCANFKGGVGKTTVCVSLAQYLCRAGSRVLVVDMDPQGSLTSLFGLLPDSDVEDERTILPKLESDEGPHLREIIRPTHWHDLDLIPASLSVFSAEYSIPARQQEAGPGFPFYELLSNALDEVADDYDVILIDSQPALGYLTTNAIYAADGLIIPLPPGMMDYASCVSFLHLLQETLDVTQRHSTRRAEGYDWLRFLITRHDRSVAHDTVTEWIRRTYQEYVIPSPIYTTSVVHSLGARMLTPYESQDAEAEQKGRKRIDKRTLQRAYDILDDAYSEVGRLLRESWGYVDPADLSVSEAVSR